MRSIILMHTSRWGNSFTQAARLAAAAFHPQEEEARERARAEEEAPVLSAYCWHL